MIRKATMSDLDRIMEIFAIARAYMWSWYDGATISCRAVCGTKAFYDAIA